MILSTRSHSQDLNMLDQSSSEKKQLQMPSQELNLGCPAAQV